MPDAISQEEIKEVLKRYQQKIEGQLLVPVATLEAKAITTREYQEFKKQYLPRPLSIYEKLCQISAKILQVKPDAKRAEAIQEAIAVSHLDITPTGVISFSLLAPLFVAIFGSLFGFVLLQSFFFVVFFTFFGIAMISPLAKLPEFIASGWRMKASNQMVLCIFYVVTYMRHTSNLERAVDFAAEHLSPPLALDLKRLLWEVETEKYENVKEALDSYLETWKKWNLEFVEAFHLIESSLYEPAEARRLELLEKSLTVILDGTYEKMLHYAQNLKSPITMLHMLGVIMPILGLVILPLVVSFLPTVKWYHIAALYNIALPVGVYYYGKNILAKRPTGYGETDISELPEFQKFKNIIINPGKNEIRLNPLTFSLLIGLIFFVIGISPLILHALNPDFEFTFYNDKFQLLGYRESTNPEEIGEIIGPYGLGASILSLALPLALAFAIGLYYRYTSANVIKIRENAKKLEKEFSSALFQLGNRLEDGLPAEIAFDKVASVMEGTVSGNFFRLVSMNIRRLGMGIQEAIFGPISGAIHAFPSNIIESAMKVLIESAKKGPKIAAQAIVSVSRYIQEIHKVNERLKDLLADVISSMNSQIAFLTPVIAGIVIGITSMVTTIISQLRTQLARIAEQPGASAAQTGLLGIFGDGVPTFYFQIIVGVYVVQIVYILTILSNGIENGSDRLNEKYLMGQNLIRSTVLYVIISLIIILIFNFIAVTILKGFATPA